MDGTYPNGKGFEETADGELPGLQLCFHETMLGTEHVQCAVTMQMGETRSGFLLWIKLYHQRPVEAYPYHKPNEMRLGHFMGKGQIDFISRRLNLRRMGCIHRPGR